MSVCGKGGKWEREFCDYAKTERVKKAAAGINCVIVPTHCPLLSRLLLTTFSTSMTLFADDDEFPLLIDFNDSFGS